MRRDREVIRPCPTIATGRSDRPAIVAPNRNLWSSVKQTRNDRANRVRKLRSCDGIVPTRRPVSHADRV